MKVAIDTSPLTSGHKYRGIGFQTKGLIESLKKISPKYKSLSIDYVDFEGTDLSKYDIAHYQSFSPFFKTLPERYKTISIVTIDDLIPLIYPDKYPPGLRGKRAFSYQKRRAKKADAIITISETSKKDIVRLLGIPSEKIYVTPLAHRDIFKVINSKPKLEKVRKKFKLPQKFVLYVGDVNYNKNVPNLIRACDKAGCKLVIVGKQAVQIGDIGVELMNMKGPRDWYRYLFGKEHPETAHYQELGDLFDQEDLTRTGFVTDDELIAIYNLATLYCQPSLYEGFGLPLLEAAACGTPVLANKTQSLVEVGEGFAEFVDATDVNAFSKRLSMLIKSKKKLNGMIKNGLEVCKEFTWEKTAEETIKVYEELL